MASSVSESYVFHFIVVVIVFLDLVLSFAFVVYESVQLRHVPTAMDREDVLPLFVLLMYLGQVSTYVRCDVTCAWNNGAILGESKFTAFSRPVMGMSNNTRG